MTGSPGLPRLMLVTDRRRAGSRGFLPALLEAVSGGVRMVQVREKDLEDGELERIVREIRAGVPPGTLLLVNGRVGVARSLGTGVHLPAGAPPDAAAGIHPRGRSAHDEAEVRRAVEESVDYLIVGTVFPTASKPGHPGGGVEIVRRLAALADPIPVFAIGGITVSHVPEVIHAGAHGIAVCGQILGASDPRRAAEAFLLALTVTVGPY